ncbi:MAG: hypothetical protein ACK55I_46470, partial [bacterium]
MTRPDFHQHLAGLRLDGFDDLRDHPRVVQEVLTESFAGEHHRRSAAAADAAVPVVRAGDVGGPSAPSREVGGERDGG